MDDAVKVPHSTCQQIWKTQQWPQNWKRSAFIPIPKKGNAKECSNYRSIALISHASTEKEMATHSSIPAWRIPWTKDPGGLQAMGSQRVGHDWVTEMNWTELKPVLKDFVHSLTSIWNEPNCMVVWTFFGIALLWDWNENWPFPVLWPLLSFSNLVTYPVLHLNSIIF